MAPKRSFVKSYLTCPPTLLALPASEKLQFSKTSDFQPFLWQINQATFLLQMNRISADRKSTGYRANRQQGVDNLSFYFKGCLWLGINVPTKNKRGMGLGNGKDRQRNETRVRCIFT